MEKERGMVKNIMKNIILGKHKVEHRKDNEQKWKGGYPQLVFSISDLSGPSVEGKSPLFSKTENQIPTAFLRDQMIQEFLSE